MNSNFNEYAEKLSRRIWITKGSRFISSRTLASQSQLSITSISFLSIYAIAISVIQNIIDSTNQCINLNNLYTIIAILLSVFILVLSLLEGTKNYQLRAERLYNNATELSKLYKEMEYLQYCNLEFDSLCKQLRVIRDRYNELIDKCPENHDSDDYWLFKTENLKEFRDDFQLGLIELSSIRSLWVRTIYMIKHYWLYIVSIVFPIPLFIWLYSFFKCNY